MITFDKKTLAGAGIIVILSAGLLIAVSLLHQTPAKSRQIFRDALSDMQEDDYSNAYYLFPE